MCGIAAIIHPGDTRPRHDEVVRMVHALAHRGDQPPVVRSLAYASLGCARLAIVDAAGGSQPMTSDGATIVFNGQIYNHVELRAELAAAGEPFASQSDTEVVLKAWRRWGAECLMRLEGMYAFVIVDSLSGGWFAARDSFGIKPLYHAERDGAWHFASEIAPLLEVGGDAIAAFPPGWHMTNGHLAPSALPDGADGASPPTFAVAATRLQAQLAASVERHLPPGDERVAVFCSGGIDSSAIAYEAVEACARRGWDPRRKLALFAIGTASAEDPMVARALADRLGVPFQLEEINREAMVSSVDEAVATIESFEPNHIRAGTASLALARRARRDGYRVALVGEGADELLGGYEEFPDAVRRGVPAEAAALLETFTHELHRTQLRRVDRTTMAFGIEARVPFLDDRMTRYIKTLPLDYKIHRRSNGKVIGKHVLREAYRGRLPDAIVDRRKIPMGEGAGIGDNRSSSGLFEQYAKAAISEAAHRALARRYPDFALKSREESYYFTLFVARFGALRLAATRPRTNLLATT